MPREGCILLDDCRIIFRNFKGVEGPFNREGDRNFAVILEDDNIVQMLKEDGWNVKYLKPREEGDDPTPYLQVSVNFNKKPPRIYMVTSRNRTQLGENEVEVLDNADIIKTDLIICPYHWNVSGNTGIKAYLQSLYVTIEEDALEQRYNALDDNAIPMRNGKVDE